MSYYLGSKLEDAFLTKNTSEKKDVMKCSSRPYLWLQITFDQDK